jgi:uncharacterized protein YicC (UPF0701 family)
MRLEEGRAMAQELLQLRDQIGRHLGAIRARTPQVAETYRDRVLERVRTLLREVDVEIDRKDLIKEVAIFAERADVSEEVVRLWRATWTSSRRCSTSRRAPGGSWSS